MLVLVVNPKPLQVSETVASLSFVLVFFASSLYHACDAENSPGVYCGDAWCAAPNANMHMMDYIAAGWGVHATLLIGWTPSSSRRLLYCFAVAVALPFAALLLEAHGYGFYYFMIVVAFADLYTRAQSTLERNLLMQEQKLVRAPVTTLDWLQQRWTLNPAGGWQIWLPMTVILAGVAFLVDSVYQISMSYYERHTVWHACTATAGVTAVMMFKRPAPPRKPTQDTLDPKSDTLQSLLSSRVDEYI
jgi:hypothetical protein